MPTPDPTVGPVPTGRDPEEYDRSRRRVLWSMPSGLFVVGSRSGDRRNLMTCNWVMQVATAPKLVAVSIETGSLTRELIEGGRGFSVSVLARADRSVVRRFVKPVREVALDGAGAAVSLQGEPVHEEWGGLPCLSNALSWLACEVRHSFRLDGETPGRASHVLFVGEVVDVGASRLGDDTENGTADALTMGDTRMNYGG